MAEQLAVHRLSAFTLDGVGGNPAGIVISDEHPACEAMQATAAAVGFSETAFLAPVGERRWRVRYYSPRTEVAFCGHATIASAVVLADRFGSGRFTLETNAGTVAVTTSEHHGEVIATFLSPPAGVSDAPTGLVDAALVQLRWARRDLDPALPPAVAFAGARHLVLAAATKPRLDRLEYDFDGLRTVMLAHDLTTLLLVWRDSDRLFHARNPFPVGGVVEDPATGAAAAAFGGYLRSLGVVEPPVRITLLQGAQIGRPSRLLVDVPVEGGIAVSGTATPIPDDQRTPPRAG
jgi:PhzF family phenazine biosynthesis protein